MSPLRHTVKCLLAAIGLTCRPSLLIIGAQKCGTDSLFRLLASHPHVVPAHQKEINFFDRDANFRKGLAWYHSYFPLRHKVGRHRITLEGSPSYLYSTKAPQRIARYDRRLHLLVAVRNPVERAYSQWNMYRQLLESNPDYWRNEVKDASADERSWVERVLEAGELPGFEQMITDELDRMHSSSAATGPGLVRRGLYQQQLDRYLEYFPDEQIMVIPLDDLKSDPVATMKKVAEFAELPDHEWSQQDLSPRHVRSYCEPMNNRIHDELIHFYSTPNRQLYEYLGRDLGW